MPVPQPQLRATGNLYPMRFVMLSTTEDNSGAQATANAQVIGVSGVGTNYPPINDAHVTVAGYHAVDGDVIQLHGNGDICLLEAGDVVASGDRLKADSNGKGVPIATTGTTVQQIGAVALEAAPAAGVKIRVQVQCRSERPAVA